MLNCFLTKQFDIEKTYETSIGIWYLYTLFRADSCIFLSKSDPDFGKHFNPASGSNLEMLR